LSEIQYRPYREGDETAILELFPVCFGGRTLPMEFWQWRFRDNPTGKIAIELAWKNDALIAQCAVSPHVITISGEDHFGGLTMEIMTHPNHRGKGLFVKLASRLHRRLEQDKFSLLWAFPNKYSHRIFIADLNWHDVWMIPMMELKTANFSSSKTTFSRIRELHDFDNRFNDLFDTIHHKREIVIKRDLKYLRWRFNNPLQKYRIVGLFSADELLGYVVLSYYIGTQLQVVDFLSVPDRSVYRELMGFVLGIAEEENMSSVKLWVSPDNPLHLELERMGFDNAAPLTYFVARSLGPSLPRDWYFTMSDSDNF
jgi:hypothetical protein